MSKNSSKGKLAAALSPIFNHFAGLIKRVQAEFRPRCGVMEALEERTLLSGGLVQPFVLPNASVSDSVYDAAADLHAAFTGKSAPNLKYATRTPAGARSAAMASDSKGVTRQN